MKINCVLYNYNKKFEIPIAFLSICRYGAEKFKLPQFPEYKIYPGSGMTRLLLYITHVQNKNINPSASTSLLPYHPLLHHMLSTLVLHSTITCLCLN